jgi:hypothetical protein
MIADEAWRPIVGHEGIYDVSDWGRLRSKYLPGGKGRLGVNWRMLQPSVDQQNRPFVTLYSCGRPTQFLVSRLVADAFLPPKTPTDTVIRHLNDNPSDNRAVNLARGTQKDNMADAIRNGRLNAPRGTANGRAKMTEDQVREIRRLYATGDHTLKELAVRFGVDRVTIRCIIKRLTWEHVARIDVAT